MHNVASFCMLYVLLKVFICLFICVWLFCWYVVLWIILSARGWWKPEKSVCPLDPDLQVVVSHLIWVLGTESQTLCKSSECFLLLSHVFSPYAIVLPLLLARPLFSCAPVVPVTVGGTCKSEMGSMEVDVRQWLWVRGYPSNPTNADGLFKRNLH